MEKQTKKPKPPTITTTTKKRWGVTLPIAGFVYVEVEADDEESAIEAGLISDFTADDIAEWETHRQLVRGNVISFSTNEASAEEVE